ncbi:MAG: ADP-L-glycero-D-manno-heptose-6-epimerase [Bacteroidota bacterium]|nr:ADP-L-glycero-D-manno-heptose-6-epimerase [Bacteroidota bacterium]
MFFYNHCDKPGIYNVGSGQARTFNDLVNSIFTSLTLLPQIEYIPIPEDIRDKYQYFTQAKMEKLFASGYQKNFLPIEKGVENYVNFLQNP